MKSKSYMTLTWRYLLLILEIWWIFDSISVFHIPSVVRSFYWINKQKVGKNGIIFYSILCLDLLDVAFLALGFRSVDLSRFVRLSLFYYNEFRMMFKSVTFNVERFDTNMLLFLVTLFFEVVKSYVSDWVSNYFTFWTFKKI